MSNLTAQQTASLQKLYQKADKDKSGSLSRREVRHLIRHIFRQEGRDDFNAKYLATYSNMVFKEHDTDGSKSLDFDEFVNLYQKLMQDTKIPDQIKRKATFSLLKLSEGDKREYLKYRHSVTASKLSLIGNKPQLTRQNTSANMPEVIIKSYFQKYCKPSETCGAAELKSLSYDLGIYISEEEAQLILGNLDCDGSGEICVDEFISWWRTEKKFDKLASVETPEMQQAVQYFQYFDEDKNGVVCRREFEGLHADLVKNGLMAESPVDQAWGEVAENDVVNFNTFLQWLGLAKI